MKSKKPSTRLTAVNKKQLTKQDQQRLRILKKRKQFVKVLELLNDNWSPSQINSRVNIPIPIIHEIMFYYHHDKWKEIQSINLTGLGNKTEAYEEPTYSEYNYQSLSLSEKTIFNKIKNGRSISLHKF